MRMGRHKDSDRVEHTQPYGLPIKITFGEKRVGSLSGFQYGLRAELIQEQLRRSVDVYFRRQAVRPCTS